MGERVGSSVARNAINFFAMFENLFGNLLVNTIIIKHCDRYFWYTTGWDYYLSYCVVVVVVVVVFLTSWLHFHLTLIAQSPYSWLLLILFCLALST